MSVIFLLTRGLPNVRGIGHSRGLFGGADFGSEATGQEAALPKTLGAACRINLLQCDEFLPSDGRWMSFSVNSKREFKESIFSRFRHVTYNRGTQTQVQSNGRDPQGQLSRVKP